VSVADTKLYRGALPQKGEPAWLRTRREAGLARFEQTGFPTRRQESWRYTDLRALQLTPFPPARDAAALSPDAIAPWRFAGETHRLVFVDGKFSEALSAIGTLSKGATIGPVSTLVSARPALLEAAFDAGDDAAAQPFAALNAAIFADGFVLALEAGVTLDKPVEIIHWVGAGAARSCHLRNLVNLAPNARATLIESFAGSGLYWNNAVTRIALSEGAALSHAKVQSESEDGIHLALNRVTLAAKSAYQSFVLTLGAKLSRHETQALLAGEGASVGLDGAFLLRGSQDATNVTFVDHAAPGGTTRELFKGVADDRAHGAFLGTIAVRPHAQKTDAQQTSRNLLLSPRAAIDTKPELEIFADDVKCAHGATVGDLDEAALFYLESRGIPADAARRMLIEAFAADALDRVTDQPLRDFLDGHLQRWLKVLPA
jgi:Fe-S cluster assembly protein SufD